MSSYCPGLAGIPLSLVLGRSSPSPLPFSQEMLSVETVKALESKHLKKKVLDSQNSKLARSECSFLVEGQPCNILKALLPGTGTPPNPRGCPYLLQLQPAGHCSRKVPMRGSSLAHTRLHPKHFLASPEAVYKDRHLTRETPVSWGCSHRISTDL